MALIGLLRPQNWPWRFLVLEGIVWLALASAALRLVPFRRLTVWLGPVLPPGPRANITPTAAQERQAWRVGAAVVRAARTLPWDAPCLPQAMAAKAMLARRGLRTSLHLGAMPGEGEARISAHAWLMFGSRTVTGRSGRSGHAEIARFG